MFITFEGLDGSGKTTQANWLVSWLWRQSLNAIYLREPGDTGIGTEIRNLLLQSKVDIKPETEFLLFSAARAQLVRERILPALKFGSIVVCDRYVDSSVAYQFYGHGISEDMDLVTWFATARLTPDLTFYLDIDPDVGLARKDSPKDRMESQDLVFKKRVRAGYKVICKKEPNRCIQIDASQSIDDVHQFITGFVKGRLDRNI